MQNTKHKYSGVTIIFGGPYRVAIYVRVSPDTSSFLTFVRASGRVFENRRFVRVFSPIRKYIRTLPIAKVYDSMRQSVLFFDSDNMVTLGPPANIRYER